MTAKKDQQQLMGGCTHVTRQNYMVWSFRDHLSGYRVSRGHIMDHHGITQTAGSGESVVALYVHSFRRREGLHE